MQAERIVKALANKRRLAILDLLDRKGELAVSDISAGIKLSFKATSKHLLILAHADIVDRRQESLIVYYCLVKPVTPLVRAALNLL